MPQRIRNSPLLFWQIILLFVALGTLLPLYGSICLFAALLLYIACLTKKTTPANQHSAFYILSLSFLIYSASFGLGYFTANTSLPETPNLPTWADSTDELSLTAKVDQVDAMPEGRLRIILSEVTPTNTEANQKITPLPAKLVWSWLFPPAEHPLPGQKIKTSLRIREVRGMSNPGTFNIENYWRQKGVGFRAWSKAEKGSFEPISSPPIWHTARSWVESKLLAALLPKKLDHSAISEPEDNKPLLTGGKAVIPALLMGNKYYLTTPELELFAAASLSHSLALSGLHLGLMATLGSGLAFLVCRIWPQIMLRIPRPKLAVLFATPLVLLYMWLGGLTPSLLRAALMFACWGWLLLQGRPKVLLDGLFWALLIMLILDPLALHDIRLQLSATCIAAIGLVLPYSLRLSRHLFPKDNKKHSFLRGTTSLLLVSVAIQVVLLPIQSWSFGQATPWFILNLLWLPVLSVFVFPLSVLGLILSVIPGLNAVAALVFDLAAMPTDWLFSLLNYLENENLLRAPAVVRPIGTASMAYWVLLLVLVVAGSMFINKPSETQKRKNTGLPRSSTRLQKIKAVWSSLLKPHNPAPFFTRPLILMLVCGWFLTAFYLFERWQAEYPEGPRMVMIDVGQGQAILFEGIEGQRILIDGGGFWGSSFDIGKSVLAPSLTLNRAPRLDAVINTHPDRDHIAGLIFILKRFEVKSLYLGQGLPKGQYGKELAETLLKYGYANDLSAPPLRAGDELKLDSQHILRVLHPQLKLTKDPNPKIVIRKTNNASLVIQLITKERNLALTCGDIDLPAIKTLLNTVRELEGPSLKSEILVLPHHGSKHSFDLDFYNAVNPEITLASAGYKNRWGFPVQIIRDEMEHRNIPLYSSSKLGQVIIEWDENYNKKIHLSRPE